MATVETTTEALSDLLATDRFQILDQGFAPDLVNGYAHGEILAMVDGVYEALNLATGTGNQLIARGVAYGAILTGATSGLVVVEGGVRASKLVGYAALSAANKNIVKTALRDVGIYVI